MMSGTFGGELHRTAEMFVSIADKQGVYFALSFLVDSSYQTQHLKQLLPILESTKGSIKKGASHDAL